MAHPSKGANYLQVGKKVDGIQVSVVTNLKIHEREGLGRRHARWLAIEKRLSEHPIELTAELVASIEKQSP